MYKDMPAKKLDKRAIRYERTKDIIESFFTLAVFVLLMFLTIRFNWPIWLMAIWIVLPITDFLLSLFLLPYLKLKAIRYEMHALHLEVMNGLFFKKRTVIPIERIQHVVVKEGPLTRKYRIQIVEVFTAGTGHEIPLLLKKEAEELRIQLLDQIKAVKSDV
ncbi:MAG: PH domain-containing protein [Carnobacterium sp.]|uniref:PH domain-containing protein n=1 Tax=Carnobacterium sp. TaxID=48221 RepID=UPI0033146877